MASIGAVLATQRNVNNPDNLPVDCFELRLNRINSRMWFEPGDTITGNVILNSFEDFRCHSVDVTLEGVATVSYQSGSAIKPKTENIITETFIFFGGAPDDRTGGNVPRARHKLPFSLPVPKLSPFLGSFKGNSGNIEYKIAAHINSTYYAIKVVEKPIRMKSYCNVVAALGDAAGNKPYVTEGPIKKSIFSSSSSLKYKLTLPLQGVVAGETFQFHLELLNPHDKNITRKFVTLMKKTTFRGESTMKSSKLILDSKTTKDDSSLNWTESLHVPPNSYPSTVEYIIQIQYYILLEVFTDEHSKEPKLKAEVPLLVGTEEVWEGGGGDENEKSDQQRPLAKSYNAPSSPRRSSMQPPPPNYSQLSTRSSSLETLPPKYEDVQE